MWQWLGYPPVPSVPMPEPMLAKLAVSKADWMHGVEGLWHMGLDAGRTEGAMAVVGILLALAFAGFVFGVGSKLTGAFLSWVAKR